MNTTFSIIAWHENTQWSKPTANTMNLRVSVPGNIHDIQITFKLSNKA
ncbi:hypothetical protein HYT57_04535 [Candidatus Woesearchaeota archaeon]|nr:hypothetical protein [Candidatus Woesearchaeota archaeon]